MTKIDTIPVKIGITGKIDAIQMLLLFNNRKDKKITQKHFYRSVFDIQFKNLIDELKKENPDQEIYTQIFLQFKDVQDD